MEIRPRVSGYIDKVAFTAGSLVKRGALLFVIDPRPYQAEYDRAAADLKRKKTALDLGQIELTRVQRLKDSGAVSQEELDQRAPISYGRSQSRRDALRIAAAASDKAADLARKRFEGGLIDFLEVLDAERTALSAELLLSQSRTDAATPLVAVYKALGAGWQITGKK